MRGMGVMAVGAYAWQTRGRPQGGSSMRVAQCAIVSDSPSRSSVGSAPAPQTMPSIGRNMSTINPSRKPAIEHQGRKSEFPQKKQTHLSLAAMAANHPNASHGIEKNTTNGSEAASSGWSRRRAQALAPCLGLGLLRPSPKSSSASFSPTIRASHSAICVWWRRHGSSDWRRTKRCFSRLSLGPWRSVPMLFLQRK